MKEVLLKTEKLSKAFSNGGSMQHVLKNIDLELYKGDFTAVSYTHLTLPTKA